MYHGDVEMSVSDFNNLVIQGNTTGETSSRTFEFAAYDGTDWSDFVHLNVSNMGNEKPVLNVKDIYFTPGSSAKFFSDHLCTWQKYQHLTDNNPAGGADYQYSCNGKRLAVQYEIKDNTGGNNFTLNRVEIDALNGYIIDTYTTILNNTTNDASNDKLHIKADPSKSTQIIQIRASDGMIGVIGLILN